MDVPAGATLAASGGTLNAPALTGAGAVSLGAGGLTLNPSGDSTFGGSVAGTGSLSKSGAGNLTLSGNNTYTGATNVSAGTLTVTGTNATSGYVVASGATLDLGGMGIRSGASLAVNGTVQNAGNAPYSLTGGATLSGTGTVPVSVTNTGGSVLPGGAPAAGQIGTLSINGDYTQGANGVFNLEVASYTSFDKLLVSGEATLGGTLNVIFLPGFVFTNPTQFDFLTAGGVVSGNFQTVNVMGLPRGVQASVVNSANGVSVTVIPEAGSGLLTLLAGAPGAALVAARRLRKKKC